MSILILLSRKRLYQLKDIIDKNIKKTKKLKKAITRSSLENGRHELQKQVNYNDVRLRGVTLNKKRYVCMIY